MFWKRRQTPETTYGDTTTEEGGHTELDSKSALPPAEAPGDNTHHWTIGGQASPQYQAVPVYEMEAGEGYHGARMQHTGR
jgi:hypothetical protein